VSTRAKAWVCSLLARIPGSNAARDMGVCDLGMSFCAGRSLCDGPIPRPGESYAVYVSLSVIRCKSILLHLRWVGRGE
jgi:hypothetical protein